MRIGDAVKKYQIKTNNIWDLSHSEKATHALNETYEDFKTDTITSLFNGTRKYYVFNSDSLLYLGLENPLEKDSFYIAEVSCIFPITLGSNHCGVFAGYANYCDKMRFHKYGTYTVYSDSIGSLMLPDGSVVGNTLQICRKRKYMYDQLDSDTLAVDSVYNEAEILQKLTEGSEIYTEFEKALYVKGYRYPVVTDFTLYAPNGEVCTKETYFTPLDEEEGIHLDEANTQARSLDNEDTDDSTSDDNIIGTFVRNNTNSKEIVFDCEKYADAYPANGTMQCRLLLSDQKGIVYRSREFTLDSSARSEVGISYLGLRPGQYVMYLIINNQTYTSNFIFE